MHVVCVAVFIYNSDMSDYENKRSVIDMDALESIANQLGLGERTGKAASARTEGLPQTLLDLACSNDHRLSTPKDEGITTFHFDFRNKRVELIDELVVKIARSIIADDIDLESIEKFFKHLEAFHYISYCTSSNYIKNDTVLGNKTEAANKVEDECWRRVRTALQRASSVTKERFVELIKIHGSRRYEEEQLFGGSVYSMLGGLPELGKNR